jgi:hypothetical protein
VSDIDAVVLDTLKALDAERPIREAALADPFEDALAGWDSTERLTVSPPRGWDSTERFTEPGGTSIREKDRKPGAVVTTVEPPCCEGFFSNKPPSSRNLSVPLPAGPVPAAPTQAPLSRTIVPLKAGRFLIETFYRNGNYRKHIYNVDVR